MEIIKKLKLKQIVITSCIMTLLLYSAIVTYRIIKWKAYIWIPSYISSYFDTNELVPDNKKHLIFIMVDHYEPGQGEKATQFNEDWLDTFALVADKHSDSYGNRFRYTWFYPFDLDKHHNEKVLVRLGKSVFDGYGEIELHWHHPQADSLTFPKMLEEAIQWFQQYGAFISSGPTPDTNFSFIHGNWALDGSNSKCGVNNELDILLSQGAYADFTFSTIGTVSQPEKINSIYYAYDTEDPKSYNNGFDAKVGKPRNDALMIFEGPLSINWDFTFEYGAVESYYVPSRERIAAWINANIHVQGRPEWVFVKIYSHGAQSAAVIVHKYLDLMLQWLEDISKERGIKLHYMTAREAFNVVKAAEDGKKGNPEDYRDYKITKPCNMLFHTEVPVIIENCTESETRFRPL